MDLDSTISLPVARRGSAGTTTFEVGPHGLRESHLTHGTLCENKQPGLWAHPIDHLFRLDLVYNFESGRVANHLSLF